MMKFSRRSIIVGGCASAGLTVLAAGISLARTVAKPKVRYSAHAPEGKEMLKIYAGAVGRMMEWDKTQKGDPRSWLFQWYTHSLPGADHGVDAAREQAIREVYGTNTTNPNAALAKLMWITCQPHYTDRSDDFLPWHRMYVLYFEEIIRAVSGRNDFTLPYWDYTDPRFQALPEEFRKPYDRHYAPLFRHARAAYSNAGKPITTGRPASSLNLESMITDQYSGKTGFCNQLDTVLHGNVHDFTGNAHGMGAVPTAAGDPIFWLHHCNIDRVWASWNKAGKQNPDDPTWTARTYIFVNGHGAKVTPSIGSMLDSDKLGYSYDKFLKPPRTLSRISKGAPTAGARAVAVPRSLAATPNGVIALGGERLNIALKAPSDAKTASFTERLQSVAPDNDIFLIFDGLHSDAALTVTYDVYLSATADFRLGEDHYAGTFNFFGAESHGHAGANGGPEAEAILEVTDIVARLQRQGLTTEPLVTLIPSSTPSAAAAPSVQDIVLATG